MQTKSPSNSAFLIPDSISDSEAAALHVSFMVEGFYPSYTQASAAKPLRSTMLSSFLDGPLGFFLPCSHFCTVDGLVLR